MAYKNGRNSALLVGKSKYNALLASFREIPGNISRAARAASVSNLTAKKAWETGWPNRQLPAIKDVLKEEYLLARSRRQASVIMETDSDNSVPKTQQLAQSEILSDSHYLDSGAQAAGMLAKDDAAVAREQEGQMIKLARANTISLMASTSRLLSSAIDKARTLELELKSGQHDFTPKQVQKFMTSLGYLVSKATESAKLTIEMERLVLGEPTEIIGMNVRNMTLEDAVKTIELSNRALERARARGLVPPVDVVADALAAPVDPPASPDNGVDPAES